LDGAEFGGFASAAPVVPEAVASGEAVGDVGEDGGEEIVVETIFKELGVGVGEELEDGEGGVGFLVVDEGGGVADDEEIAGRVAHAGGEDFGLFAGAEGEGFAADDLDDGGAVEEEEIGGGEGLALVIQGLVEFDDGVVFAEGFFERFFDGRGEMGEAGLEGLVGGEVGGVGVNPLGGEGDEGVPGAGEGEVEFEADDAVGEVAEVGGDGVAGGESDGGKRLFKGWAFEADGGGKGGRGEFEAVEIDLGADLVEVLEVEDALDVVHGNDRLLRSI